MKVLILSDGRAGHVNQSRAIGMALARNFAVTVTTLRCNLRAGFLRYLLRTLLHLTGGRLPPGLWKLFHLGETLPAEKPDLIVSAGGHTACANAWLARVWKCRNLFCGDVRGLRPSFFSGIISAYDGDTGKPGFIISPTPVAIDRSELATNAALWRKRSGTQDARCWSLLAGGDGAGYYYLAEDWQRLAVELETLAKRYGIRWLLTTSRRSGPEANVALGRVSPQFLAGMALAGGKSDLAYHEILGAAERHFVTEDSHMMISEAVATGAPVHTLQPEKFKTDESNLHFLRLYESKGWITRHPIAGAASGDFSSLECGSKDASSVLDELAEKLAAWWQK